MKILRFFQIFYLVTKEEGCYPTMFKLGKVCSLWRDVSLDKRLWHTLDLNSLKESKKTEEKLKWIITSRMIGSTDINISKRKKLFLSNHIP